MFGFIQIAGEDPFFYFSWVFAVIVSVVLHELAHGWAAIRVGDDTPRETGHMTGNPLVHMGPVSLLVLVFIGIAWGAMPVNPTRFRGKYAEAFVAAAGPVMNIVIALVALTILGFIHVFAKSNETQVMENIRDLLGLFGMINIALAFFNLAPVPPLDGASILANVNHGYSRWLMEHYDKHNLMFIGYFIIMSGMISSGMGIWTWGEFFGGMWLLAVETVLSLVAG